MRAATRRNAEAVVMAENDVDRMTAVSLSGLGVDAADYPAWQQAFGRDYDAMVQAADNGLTTDLLVRIREKGDTFPPLTSLVTIDEWERRDLVQRGMSAHNVGKYRNFPFKDLGEVMDMYPDAHGWTLTGLVKDRYVSEIRPYADAGCKVEGVSAYADAGVSPGAAVTYERHGFVGGDAVALIEDGIAASRAAELAGDAAVSRRAARARLANVGVTPEQAAALEGAGVHDTDDLVALGRAGLTDATEYRRWRKVNRPGTSDRSHNRKFEPKEIAGFAAAGVSSGDAQAFARLGVKPDRWAATREVMSGEDALAWAERTNSLDEALRRHRAGERPEDAARVLRLS